MKASELIRELAKNIAEHGDMDVRFSDYAYYTATGEDREVILGNVFKQDERLYITDAPWWECP